MTSLIKPFTPKKQNGIDHSLIWKIPYRSVWVNGLRKHIQKPQRNKNKIFHKNVFVLMHQTLGPSLWSGQCCWTWNLRPFTCVGSHPTSVCLKGLSSFTSSLWRLLSHDNLTKCCKGITNIHNECNINLLSQKIWWDRYQHTCPVKKQHWPVCIHQWQTNLVTLVTCYVAVLSDIEILPLYWYHDWLSMIL